MNIIIFVLFIAVLVVVGVFLICYKIPHLLQVLLMRRMMNKVVERGYISKFRRLKEYVLSFLHIRRG